MINYARNLYPNTAAPVLCSIFMFVDEDAEFDSYRKLSFKQQMARDRRRFEVCVVDSMCIGQPCALPRLLTKTRTMCWIARSLHPFCILTMCLTWGRCTLLRPWRTWMMIRMAMLPLKNMSVSWTCGHYLNVYVWNEDTSLCRTCYSVGVPQIFPGVINYTRMVGGFLPKKNVPCSILR